MASKKFVQLERHVEAEYRKKGYGLKKARRIGKAVAGEVATRKHKRRGTRHVKRAARSVTRGLTRFGRRVWNRSIF
ncbi:MAG: hypothetical protein C7B46_11565 [Sulfobacillus benefaciens]|uniref:Uncharacterized protein n=1 Tax=Sulfobacillus benefaciens TaxID=453960 RepID=A0A2T2XEU4_9FIRM|nr:MAG: hypothetical protein C7B46_11565 [Sulfobacillus benefaciens]